MCGIAGAIAPDLDADTLTAAVERMTAALYHRGPDAHGCFSRSDLACALGHARLSIIDLSQAGHQPMVGAGGRHVIVFNGEVYNFRELRDELALGGRAFVSRSDTEVVLAAYEQWGSAAFERLNGMFALAILDTHRRRIVLARDRLGIKPLYVANAGRRWVFASEIKGIEASGLVDMRPDLEPLHEFLYFGSTLGTRTLSHGVAKLLPAHWLEVDLDTGASGPARRYWSPATRPTPVSAPPPQIETAVEQTRSLLESAVRRQLVADVPVGVFLSGGVDSTAIVALASRHYAGKLRTYSVGFDYIGDGQELPTARRIAKRFGTEHHELHVDGANMVDVIERLAQAHDQPFADPANLPLYQLCQALGGETKVVLQGDGGDELFGGYRRYEYLGAASVLRPLAAAGDRLLRALSPIYGRRVFGAHRFIRGLACSDAAERMALLLSVEGPLNAPTRILAPALRDRVLAQDPFSRYREVAAGLAQTDPLQQMLLTDLQILLPDVFLEKVDRATMALGIEVRVPFLDFDLVDHVVALPSSYKASFAHRKKLLKRALTGIVPDEVLHARKVGFGVPIAAWLSGPLRRYAEDRIQSCAGDYFDAAAVRATFDEHASGRRDHAQLLWKALMLSIWAERLQRSGPVAAAAAA